MSSRSETSLVDFTYAPKSLKWMMFIAGALIVIGTLNVYSATYYMNMESGISPYNHLEKHMTFLAMSLLAGWFCAKCPKEWIRQGAMLWSLGTIALLILVFLAGRTVNGATRWIYLFGFSLQPSEFAKVTALIWSASILAKQMNRHEKISLFSRFFRPFVHFLSSKKENSFLSMVRYFTPLYMPFVMACFVLKQPDMGTAGMIILFPLLLYVLAGLSWREIGAGFILSCIVFAILTIAEPYRWDRVKVILDPFPYARNDGYQTVQSLIAVGSGGFFGQSAGGGMAKFLYLPEQFTDFAFAVFSQEYGFVGAIILLILYGAFMCCGFFTANQLKNTYGTLLVYGLTLMITLQGLVNIAMVIGCFPVTGIPLPFISFGGSSLLTNICAMGLIYGTTVQCLRQSDREERMRRIAAMEGRSISFHS